MATFNFGINPAGSRLFTSASSQYFNVTDFALGAYDFTFACWVKRGTATGVNMIPMEAYAEADASNEAITMFYNEATAASFRITKAGVTVGPQNQGVVSNTLWTFLAGTATATEVELYVNLNRFTAVNTVVIPTINYLRIAANQTPAFFMNGNVRCPTIWGNKVSQANLALMANNPSELLANIYSTGLLWTLEDPTALVSSPKGSLGQLAVTNNGSTLSTEQPNYPAF